MCVCANSEGGRALTRQQLLSLTFLRNFSVGLRDTCHRRRNSGVRGGGGGAICVAVNKQHLWLCA